MYKNPFIYKRPLAPGADDLVAIERKPLLDKAISSLQFGQWLSVCCARKSGKTSFLLSLIAACEKRAPQFYFFTMAPEHLQQVEQNGFPVVVFERIRENARKHKKLHFLLPALKEDFVSFEHGFSCLGKNLKKDQRLIIAIDGLENTTKACQQTILQQLINFFTAQTTQAAFAKVQFIIAGCLAPADLRLENGVSFTEYSTKTFLEDFKFEDVDKMIKKVCSSHTIRLDEGFTRLLYEWTGGTGYLIQKICYKILETAFLDKQEPTFSTTNGDEAISSIIREGETNVELIMQGIERDTNLVEAIIRIMRNGAMQSYKFDPDLHTLVSLGALSLRNGRFRVRNPMFEKLFQDYFTSERLANLFYARKKYFRAKELFFNAVTQEIDAKNALDNLLLAIKSIQENASHAGFMNHALQVLIHAVENAKTSSFFLVDTANKKLKITDSIGMSTADISRVNLHIGEGVAGSVAQTGRIRVIRDVTDEVECPDFVCRDLAEKLDIGAMISLPVFVAGEVIGVINLCLRKPNEFTYSETKMLEILATQISSALQQQPLFHSVSHHEAMLEVLEDAILSIDSHIDAEIIFGKILEFAYSITGCKKNYAVWKDNMTNSWKFKFPNWTVKHEPNGQASRIIDKNRKSGAMFGQGKIYMTPDLENDERYLNIWKSLHADHAFRITVDGETMGCLVIDADHAMMLSNVQQKLMAMLASLAGIALKKDRLFGLAEKKTQQVITLKTIGEVVGNTKSVDELLHLIAKECLRVVDQPNKSAKILLWDRERDKLIVKAARGEEFGKMELGASLSVQDRSMVAWVLRNRKPRYAANVLEDSEYRPQNASVRSEIAVPLRFHDEILGVVDVQSTQPDDFNLQDQQSLSAVANSAAIAIKIVELTGTRLRELKALYRIGTKISSTLNTNEVMQTVCQEGLNAIGSENRAMTVHVLHPENRLWITSLTLEASLNFHGPERNRCREDGVMQWFADKKEHILIPDTAMASSYKQVTRETKSAMLVPIRFDGRLIGMIQVESRLEDDFGDAELELMSGLANQAGAALENTRLSQDLTKTQMHLSHALETAAIEETLAGLTHDIKNISSLIAGETQWLKRCQRKKQIELNNEVKSAIQNIHSYVQRVEKITNNLKRPVDKPVLEFKTANLGRLIDEAFELIASRAARNHIEIAKDGSTSDIQLRVDAGRMTRAFFNIMSNAIDAMQDGGSLTITARQNRDNVEIDFVDTGHGIPAEILNKVMTPLFSTKSEGYGLGLALTKRIIETDHQGKLTLKSKEGQGTTVRIKLPTGKASRKSGQVTKRNALSRQQKPVTVAHSKSPADMSWRVLVVNDETDMLDKIKWKLQNAGYSVTGTEYGRDAIHICNGGWFDAILMDYHLKKDRGRSCTALDFIPEIRNTLPTTPIILTSASLREKPTSSGMFDYFLEINAAFWDDVLPLIHSCLGRWHSPGN